MLNSLNHKKHLILIVFLGLLLSIFLATRSKFVVNQAVLRKSSEPKENQAANHKIEISAETKSQVEKLKSSLLTNPADKVTFLSEIGAVYYKASNFDSAGYYFEKAAILQPSEINLLKTGESYYQAASLALNVESIDKSIEKARSAYNQVLKINPTNLLAKTNLAMTFVGTDSPMKAIGMLREVLDENPKFVLAIMSLGGLSMKSGQYDKAVNRFQNVLAIDKSNVQAKMGLAYSLIELNKQEDGRKLLNEVLKENIDPVTKEEILKTLNSLK